MDQFENAVFDRQVKELKKLKKLKNYKVMNEKCLEAARLLYLENLKGIKQIAQSVFDSDGQILIDDMNLISKYYIAKGELSGIETLLSAFGHDKIWESWIE